MKLMKKKLEFSKIIFVYIAVMFTIVMVFTMVLMWYTKDTGAVAYLIPAVGGLMATTVGFYSWKAKAENLLKIKQENDITNVDVDEIAKNVEQMLSEDEVEDGEGYVN